MSKAANELFNKRYESWKQETTKSCTCTICYSISEYRRIVHTIPDEADRLWMMGYLDASIEADGFKSMEIYDLTKQVEELKRQLEEVQT